MEKINWAHRVKNIATLILGRKENPIYKRKKAAWIGHTCFLQHVTEERFNRRDDKEEDVNSYWTTLTH